MKKFLAVLMSIAMLLSACALAEGGAVEISVRNVVFLENGKTAADLSFLSAALQLGIDGDRGGMKLRFDFADRELCNALLAMIGHQILFEIGAEGVRSAYYADLTALFGAQGEMIDLGLVLESLAEALAGKESPFAIVGEELGTILEGSVRDGGTREIGGVEYDVISIYVAPAQMREGIEALVEMLVENGVYTRQEGEEVLNNFFSLGQEISLSGTICESADSGIIDLTCAVGAPGLNEPLTLKLLLTGGADAQNGRRYSVSLEAFDGADSYGLGFDVAVRNMNDLSWLPAGVGGATDILTVNDLETALTKDFEAIGRAIVNSWMRIMLTGGA